MSLKIDLKLFLQVMKPFFLYIPLFITIASLAQNPSQPKLEKNLVPNGSFENFRRKSNDIRKATPWRQIETIDYYHNPLSNDTTVQKGAYEGYCYAGFRFRKNYKEFLQVKLVEPLHRGSVYEYSMHIRLAFWSNATLRSFGALFTKAGYKGLTDAVKSSMVDTVCVNSKGLEKGYQWFTIKGFYKADGGEKYLTIGNFSPKIKKDMARIDVFRFGPKESYYFIDDISLVRARQFDEKIANVRVGPNYLELWKDSTLSVKPDIKVGEKISLNNIFFVHERYYLLPESFSELNKLSVYLMLNPDVEIQINGHSDDAGAKHKNQKISELRAREVFEYLIQRGVQNKMYYKGFGSSQPIATNDTEEGRSKNRRVEFEIIKK